MRAIEAKWRFGGAFAKSDEARETRGLREAYANQNGGILGKVQNSFCLKILRTLHFSNLDEFLGNLQRGKGGGSQFLFCRFEYLIGAFFYGICGKGDGGFTRIQK